MATSDPTQARGAADNAPCPEDAGQLDPVQEASEESFPASDAPGWIGGCADPPAVLDPVKETERGGSEGSFH
jgi:hypothetical protein